MGTPEYLRVCLMSTICSVVVLAAINSDPSVAFSTVACLVEYQSPGVRLKKCNTAVTDLPVIRSCRRLASRNVVVVTDFPRCSGSSLGISSRTLPYDRIPSTTPGTEPPRDVRDSGSARSHSTHLETSSS